MSPAFVFYHGATRERVVKKINLMFVDMLQVHKKRGAEGSSSGPPPWGPGRAHTCQAAAGEGSGVAHRCSGCFQLTWRSDHLGGTRDSALAQGHTSE